jgi:hypothetical protein
VYTHDSLALGRASTAPDYESQRADPPTRLVSKAQKIRFYPSLKECLGGRIHGYGGGPSPPAGPACMRCWPGSGAATPTGDVSHLGPRRHKEEVITYGVHKTPQNVTATRV